MKRFKKIYVEITNACNLTCSFCAKSSRQTTFMSIGNFLAIIKKIKPFTGYIYLHVKGEPLLHPNLKEILEICHQNTIKVNITTNGTLLAKNTLLLTTQPSIRQINISLHSFSEQPAIYQCNYMADVLHFVKEALAKNSMYISLRFWNLNDQNAQSVKNKEIINELMAGLGISIPTGLFESSGQSIKVAEKLFVHFDYEFTWPDKNHQAVHKKGFCYGMRDQVAVLADGTVAPCCLDGEGVINLGNIFETDFGEIINSPRATAIYNGFSNSTAVEELCIKCEYKNRFA